MSIFYHTLGYDDQLYRLKLECDPKEKTLAVSVDGQSAPWPRLVAALERQLLVYAPNVKGDYASPIARSREGNKLIFRGIGEDFALKLNTETIGTYTGDGKGNLTQTMHRPLTVGEIRRMGTFHNAPPYAQQREDLTKEDNAALLARAKKAVFTDFHTHSSGQISPQGLLKVALAHNAYYPVSLMKEAGIDTSFKNFPKGVRKKIARVPFPPRDVPNMPDEVDAIALNALEDDDLHKLALKMAMPMDRQSTYSEMEHDAYRFRYPLTKDKALFADTLKQMAREFVAQGIQHAEIAMVGLDNPDLLRILHQTMHEIEHDPEFKGFTMQFMVGIPRNFSLPKIEELLEKTKILSQSSYITGVDFIGYEVNKTKDFSDMLSRFCDWANTDRPGFNVRMHAGENDKNLDNVKDFLELAQAHPGLHFRVGHGVHGMNADTLKLAAELNKDPENPRLTIESNPDSVIALNNIDSFTDIPYKKMVDHKIPFVLSSDSAGTYGTSAEQLGLAAYYGGLDHEGFDRLEKHQQLLINQQRRYSEAIAHTIPNWDEPAAKDRLTDSLVSFLSTVPTAPSAAGDTIDPAIIAAKLEADEVSLIENVKGTPELNSRTPITLVGASGERWEQIDPLAQRETAIAVDMLVHVLDPEKAYFTQGRSKQSGLSYIGNKAIEHGNEDLAAEEKDPFYNLGMLVAPSFSESDSYKHLTHMQRVSDKLLDLADALVSHTFEQNGVLIAAGGAAFTRDIVTKADQRGILEKSPVDRRAMFLFSNTKGASAEKSKVLHPNYAVEDGIALITKLHALKPELFREGFSLANLHDLYQQSAARVEQYGYDAPVDPTQQTITTAQVIALGKSKKKEM